MLLVESQEQESWNNGDIFCQLFLLYHSIKDLIWIVFLCFSRWSISGVGSSVEGDGRVWRMWWPLLRTSPGVNFKRSLRHVNFKKRDHTSKNDTKLHVKEHTFWNNKFYFLNSRAWPRQNGQLKWIRRQLKLSRRTTRVWLLNVAAFEAYFVPHSSAYHFLKLSCLSSICVQQNCLS